jgi:hypothetical protein
MHLTFMCVAKHYFSLFGFQIALGVHVQLLDLFSSRYNK